MNNELAVSRGSVHSSKDRLVNDLRRVVDDADVLLKEVVNSSAGQFSAARSRIENRLGEARSRLHDARISATSKACDAAEATQYYVRENPIKIIGVVALAGLLAAVFLSRRPIK